MPFAIYFHHFFSFLIVISINLSFLPLLIFTQTRGREGNNVKYLKAKLELRKIKTQVPRRCLTIRRRASWSLHVHLQPPTWHAPPSRCRILLIWKRLIWQTLHLGHHVLCIQCHANAPGFFGCACVCLAAVPWKSCSLFYVSQQVRLWQTVCVPFL